MNLQKKRFDDLSGLVFWTHYGRILLHLFGDRKFCAFCYNNSITLLDPANAMFKQTAHFSITSARNFNFAFKSSKMEDFCPKVCILGRKFFNEKKFSGAQIMFFVGHYFVSGFFDSNPLQNTSFENLGFSVLIETD